MNHTVYAGSIPENKMKLDKYDIIEFARALLGVAFFTWWGIYNRFTIPL